MLRIVPILISREQRYLWLGPSKRRTLETALPHRLSTIASQCRCIDLQGDFATWFALEPPSCERCASESTNPDLLVHGYCDDGVAVTALHYPTMHFWDVRRIRQTPVLDLLTEVKRYTSPMVYENISDEDPM